MICQVTTIVKFEDGSAIRADLKGDDISQEHTIAHLKTLIPESQVVFSQKVEKDNMKGKMSGKFSIKDAIDYVRMCGQQS